MRRLLGAGVAVALLVTGGVAGAGTAMATGDPTFSFDPVRDVALMPGYGLVYVPRGASIGAGIKEAQTAGSKPISSRRSDAAGSVTVRT
ncbi:hypothetical protein ABZY57_06540 [Streptomyces sp. NPDC006450]|uniref:hypothetical protein n=1 Tax=Streptomyces sp. NPDC006450 TaxID=3155458 RepID=UPI0033A4FDDF